MTSATNSVEVLPEPLQQVANDIRGCLKNDLPYPALLLALTIPDICSALLLPIGTYVKEQHYSGFTEQYVSSDVGIARSLIYHMRGGIIHRGSAIGHSKQKFQMVTFDTEISEDVSNKMNHGWVARRGIHESRVDRYEGENLTTFLNLHQFCDAIVEGMIKWYRENANAPSVKDGLERMATISKNGHLDNARGIGRSIGGSLMYFSF